MMKRLSWFVVVPGLVLVLLSASFALADEPLKPDAPKTVPAKPMPSSLDEELLGGLKDDATLPGPKPKAEPDKPKSPLDDQLLDGLSEGEDITLGKDENPLSRITKHMREVEARIRSGKSDDTTQTAQRQIVRDLEMLIEAAQQQQQQQSGSSSKKPQGTGSRQSPKPGEKGKPQGGQSKQPATDSNAQLRKDEVKRVDAAEMQGLIKQVWGQLPERLRNQMMQGPPEQFLPKYELEIEDYFKALVKTPPDERAQR